MFEIFYCLLPLYYFYNTTNTLSYSIYQSESGPTLIRPGELAIASPHPLIHNSCSTNRSAKFTAHLGSQTASVLQLAAAVSCAPESADINLVELLVGQLSLHLHHELL